jgi:hypothetical protein
MKRVSRLIALSVTAAALSLAADSWTGHLIDANCKAKEPTAHTAKCPIGCAGGGYGVLTTDGKFVKFDEAGNEKALAALKATKKEKDLKAKITGTLENDTIKVASVEIL